MNVTSLHQLAVIKAIARNPSQAVEAHCALLSAWMQTEKVARDTTLKPSERRAAYWMLAALDVVFELPHVHTLEALGIPEEDEEEPLTAEDRSGLLDLCAVYEKQIRTGNLELRKTSHWHLTSIYEGFGLTAPTLETILNSEPKEAQA